LGRSWMTVHYYSTGRLSITAKVAAELRSWDRLMDEAERRLVAQSGKGNADA
jgi:hypothetical protein